MKISWEWLNDLVDLRGITPEMVFDKFTLHSAEMEGIIALNEHLSRVITVKILDVKPHKDADKLKIVKIDTGKETIEVVCGAHNVITNKVGVFAPVDTVLPGGFVLKPKKIRGVLSCGMLCSERDLGISNDHSGIILLPRDTPIGIPYSEVIGVKRDTVFDIDNKSLTHRPDLWGHVGIAREIAAIFGCTLKDPYTNLEEPNIDTKYKLEIENHIPDKCIRYSAVIIENIEVRPSPDWIKRRLEAVGLRSINNIVDTTNYIMLELGQPMHAFDRRRISGDTIIIRNAYNNETVITLDNRKVQLTGNEIVIADKEKAVALGGVMGLENSEVIDDTTSIILESATFNPAIIRKTANRFNMRTDAAQRFEKAQDPENTVIAILRFFELIKETCKSASMVSKIIDNYPKKNNPLTLHIEGDYIRNRLGIDIKNESIKGILKSLYFGVSLDGNVFTVKVPSFRATKDINIPIDIVEEIGRIYGYDNIKPVPLKTDMSEPVRDEYQQEIRLWRSYLSNGLNYFEVYNYSFFNENLAKTCISPTNNMVRLKKPLSKEADALVTDLLPNMLLAIKNNSRFYNHFKFYEIGRIFFNEKEDECLIMAHYVKHSNISDDTIIGFRDGLLDILDRLKYRYTIRFERPSDQFHPYRSAIIQVGKVQIYFGEINPSLLDNFNIKGRVFVAKIPIRDMFNQKRRENVFYSIPKFPVVPFDISIVMDEREPVFKVINTIKKTNKKLIESIAFVGFFQDDNLKKSGKKSATFHIEFRAKDHTLTPDEIKKLEMDIINALSKSNYPLR